MAKRTIAVFMAALMLFTAAAVWGGGKSQKGPAVTTVEWWSLWEPDIADLMIADFQAQNPGIKINRTQHGDPGIWEAMVVATATRAGPDIFFNWSGAYQASFFRRGGAISLNDYSKKYGWGSRLGSAATAGVTYNGNLTLIPYGFNAVGILYKKSTFAKYGVKEPTTYAELAAVCDLFVKNGVVPFSIGGIDTWHTMGWVDAVLEQYCGPVLHDKLNNVNDRSVSWNCPEVIAAFTELSKWISRGWVNPNFAGIAEADSHMPIYTGAAAMNVTGDWSEFSIKDAGFDSAEFGFFGRDSGTIGTVLRSKLNFGSSSEGERNS